MKQLLLLHKLTICLWRIMICSLKTIFWLETWRRDYMICRKGWFKISYIKIQSIYFVIIIFCWIYPNIMMWSKKIFRLILHLLFPINRMHYSLSIRIIVWICILFLNRLKQKTAKYMIHLKILRMYFSQTEGFPILKFTKRVSAESYYAYPMISSN